MHDVLARSRVEWSKAGRPASLAFPLGCAGAAADWLPRCLLGAAFFLIAWEPPWPRLFGSGFAGRPRWRRALGGGRAGTSLGSSFRSATPRRLWCVAGFSFTRSAYDGTVNRTGDARTDAGDHRYTASRSEESRRTMVSFDARKGTWRHSSQTGMHSFKADSSC